ncbi:MAG: hypothetical protein AB1509_01890 [Chloroflexota bacterium]
MIEPTRPTFWRFILSVTFLFVVLAGWNLIQLAGKLNVNILARPSWVAALVGLSLFAVLVLLGLITSFSRLSEKLWKFLELPWLLEYLPKTLGGILALAGVGGFSILSSLGNFQKILSGEGWARFFIFWMFSLLGMWGVKVYRREISWFTALIAVILFQGSLQLILAYWSQVTSYPFSMGWSETSRFYFPSLFLSEKIYGSKYPLPVLHPTLHLLLTPPYLFDAPLWAHRFWQVIIRYLLLAAVVPVMMKRVGVPSGRVRWLVALWMFLYLFMLPLYYHLAIPLILVLFGFSPHDDRRNWFVILLASAWCGWSRINWYPVPAMVAAVLYVLETPVQGRAFWNYLWKPVLWGIAGVLTAFVFQRFYIAISGVTDARYFYTSIASFLLWYRLFPNATYPPGLLLATFLTSAPVWFVLYLAIRSQKKALHVLRIGLLIAALAVLLAGGLLVSLKIGGGADLHNLDAYFVLMLLVASSLVFGRYLRDDGAPSQPMQLHWLVVLALCIPPLLPQIQTNVGFSNNYDEIRTRSVLTTLQEHIDHVNERGDDVLFITQRHLISMGMLNNVRLIPEYEREDLMEMAMADNVAYLLKFRSDIENQRFALIIVDPLRPVIMSSERSFAEENNVWVRRVARVILCNYREEVVFPADGIALYVPQSGERKCP